MFCNQCGKKVAANSKFCSSCGAPVVVIAEGAAVASKSRWCTCSSSVTSGTVEGIEYEVCTNCETLNWTPLETKNFIDSTFDISISFEDGMPEIKLAQLVEWLDSVMESCDALGTLAVDIDLSDPQDANRLIDQEEYFTIRQVFSSWRFDVSEDDEGLGWGGFDTNEIQENSTSNLAKGAVRNLWEHMTDYLQEEHAKIIIEHLEEQRFQDPMSVSKKVTKGAPITAAFQGRELQWALDEQWLE